MSASRPLAVLLVAVSLALAGCSADGAEPQPALPPAPATEESASASPIPEEEGAFVPVDPAEFASSAVEGGYDFVSAAGDIACGIHDLGEDWPVTYGCVMLGPYSFVDPPAPTEEIACGGGFQAEVGAPAATICRGGLVYAGEDSSFAVATLPEQRYLAVLGVTCVAEGASIGCSEDETGYGFRLSAEAYELFE